MAESDNLLTLETGKQSIVIISSLNETITLVGKDLSQNDSDVYLISPLTSRISWGKSINPESAFNHLSNIDIDYLIVYQNQSLNSWLRVGDNQKLFKRLITNLPATKTFHIIENSYKTTLEIMDSVIISLEELYGTIDSSSIILEFIRMAIEQGTIKIPGDGLDSINPLYISDAYKGIMRCLLDPYLGENNINISGPDSISYLNLAYKIRALIPHKTSIEFSDQFPQAIKLGLNLSGISNWEAEVHLNDVLDDYLLELENKFSPANNRPDNSITSTNDFTSLPPSKSEVAPITPSKEPKHSIPKPVHARPKLTPLEIPEESISDLDKKRGEIEFIKLDVKTSPLKKIKKLLSNINKKKKHRPKKKRSVFTRLLLTGTSVYFFFLIVSILISFFTFKNIAKNIKNENYTNLKVTNLGLISTSFIKRSADLLTHIPILKNTSFTGEAYTLASLSKDSLTLLKSTKTISAHVYNITNHILGNSETNLVEEINILKDETNTFYKNLSLLEASMSDSPPSIIPNKYNSDYLRLKESIGEMRRTTLAATALLNISPDLLGVGDSRKYAILLQNNMELRPTGGFIGSFAIVDFENGELFNLQVYDVYQADGQLKGYVEPPQAIKDYLGESNWYLRDSNWDPDFPTSAKRASWFIDKTIFEDVDGVIGVNLFTIQEILGKIGSVHLPDYEEEITADNLFEKAEYHSEVDFFPGSTQKREFLASLTDALFSKFESLEPSQSLNLVSAVFASLTQKNTTISLENLSSEAVLNKLDWNGSIINPNCPALLAQDTCLVDYVFVVDSNFGINKVNYFVKRNIDLSITINADKSIKNTLKLTYINTATSGSWPAGNYSNYQRIYLPLGAKIKSLTIDGVRVGDSEMKISTEHGKTILEYFFVTNIKQTKVAEIEYELQNKFNDINPSYSLYWQKQPGTFADPLNIHVNYPLYLNPTLISPEAELDTQQVNFSLNNSRDRVVTIKF